MRPAVFLDRDGTIIEEHGYIGDLALIRPFPWSAAALRDLAAAGYALVVVTNQAGVARGFFDEAFVRRAHAHLDALLSADGVRVDGYYYCPHHPAGVVDGYRRECRCRKPGPGMIEDATRDLGLDVARSWVVGDKWLDVALAAQAGARGVLVRTGYGAGAEPDPPPGVVPAAVLDHLGDAARWILTHDHVPR
jgi:D-glycero-D-manno-heptose 1,7-bisphosphate phosphatase